MSPPNPPSWRRNASDRATMPTGPSSARSLPQVLLECEMLALWQTDRPLLEDNRSSAAPPAMVHELFLGRPPMATPRLPTHPAPRHNGRVHLVHTRHHAPPHPCYLCHAAAYWQCDGPGESEDTLCGRWLCRTHRLRASADRDVCPWHKKSAADPEP
jgi:hypothetical protein